MHYKLVHLRDSKALTSAEYDQILEIIFNYIPDKALDKRILQAHLDENVHVILAKINGNVIGFSISSSCIESTPFCNHPLPVIYQRMLFLQPDAIRLKIGSHLQHVTLRHHLGWFWFVKRFVLICRTQNPTVVKKLLACTLSYPFPNLKQSPQILNFLDRLLPIIGAPKIDDEFRLIGTLPELVGVDYTDLWDRYKCRDKRVNQYVKKLLFSESNEGRIVNRGMSLLCIAYANPVDMILHMVSSRLKLFLNRKKVKRIIK